jgi:phenylacetate-CoA ligase
MKSSPEGLTSVLKLYRKMLKSCPAYARFLKDQGYKPRTLKSYDQFKQLPLMSKSNYIKKYMLDMRLYRGKKVSDYYMLCTSSGSTGVPIIWPRDYETDQKLGYAKESLYDGHFDIKNKKTLVVITFGMGSFTAGMLTARLSWEVASRNKLSVITPGMNKEMALMNLRNLSQFYDQVIIVGYPPFIADLVDYAIQHKFDFKKANTKILYTSERISEHSRHAFLEKISPTGFRGDVVGFYACGDAGIIGSETDITIYIAEKAWENENFCLDLFGEKEPPMMIEYQPTTRFLEEHKGRIIVSADQPVPLLRYDIKDRGGLISGKTLYLLSKKHKVSISKSVVSRKYAYIYGKSDAVVLTANIYIDNIQDCLQLSKFTRRFTGNFQYGTAEEGMRKRLKLRQVNKEFDMIQEGISILDFAIEFIPEDPTRYSGAKFNYFL